MKKRNGSILLTIISNVLSIGIALIISFFITRYIVTTISKEAYSFYPIASNFTTYFSAIFLITNSLSSRFIMIPYLKKDYTSSSKYCSTVLFSNIAITIFVLLLESVIYLNIDRIINIPNYLLFEVKHLFKYVFLSSIVYGLSSYFTVGYYVKERMDLQALSSIVENIVKGIIVLYLLINNSVTISSFGEALFIAAIFKSVLDICIYCYLMKDIPIKLSSFSINSLFEITKLGIWSLISQSGLLLINNIQLIISNIFLGVESASELALIQPLVSVCTLIASTVSRFIDPTITSNISNYSKDTKTNINYIYTIIELFIVIPIAVVLSISKPFFLLWIPKEYTTIIFTLTILSCLEITITYLSLINNSILTTFFKVKERAIVYLMSGFFNILLIYLLLKFTRLGNIAILISAIITYIIYHLIFIPKYTKYTLKNNNIKINYLNLLDYVLYILIALTNIIFVNIININSYFALFFTCVVLFITDTLIIIIIKKVNIKKFIYFLIQKNKQSI